MSVGSHTFADWLAHWAWTPTPLHTSIHPALWSPKHAAKSHALAVHNTWPHTYVAVRSEMGLGHPRTHVGSHATSRAPPGECVAAHPQNWTNLTLLWQSSSGHAHLWAVTYVAHMATRTRALAYMAQRVHRRYTSGGQVEAQALRTRCERVLRLSALCTQVDAAARD